jgi:uracil-DNA glycosylase
MTHFNFDPVDPSWHTCLNDALAKMDPVYLEHLYKNDQWLPGHDKIFNAFSLPVDRVNYILFGESPYPRKESANGFAFWDAAVSTLFTETGLAKPVNRATSLRNMIKMLLVAEGALAPHATHQEAIAKINKERFVQTNQALFHQFLRHGFLLLNATLVLQPTVHSVNQDAKAWRPFIKHIIDFVHHKNPDITLILLGNIANIIDKLAAQYKGKKIYSEHPYNISFITNPTILEFFKPLHILCYN